MLIEKHGTQPMFASPRWLTIGLVAGVCLTGIGLGLRAFFAGGSSGDAAIVITTPTPTATSEPTATPTETPTTIPSASPTATPAGNLAGARVAYTDKQYSTAITLFLKAGNEVTKPSEKAQIHYELGNAYRENKQNDLAYGAYTTAVGEDPHLVVAYQAHANLLVLEQRRTEARTVLQAGIDANPDNQDLKRDLSVLQLSGPGE